jgi:Rod binding domain-containing protein
VINPLRIDCPEANSNTPLGRVAVPSQLSFDRAKPQLSPNEQKLRRAAAEFESILISTFWKSMKESFGTSEDSSDPAHDTLDDLGVQAMSSAMGKAGGLGVGKMILKHLESQLADTNKPSGQPSP